MPTLVNLTFDIADLIGADFDVRRTKVWIETNIASGSVIDTTGKVVRLGDVKATVATNGTGSFTGLFATNSADLNPTGFLYQVYVDYATRADGRKLWASGWFALTATSDLATVTPVANAPVNTTEDAVIAGRVNDPASQTRAAANKLYGRGISVKAAPYNAVGDGVADDSAAIQAAIDAAGIDGTVVFPPGSYLVNTQLNPKAGQRFTGPGAVIQSTTLTTAIFNVTVSDVLFTGLSFVGPNTQGNSRGIYASGSRCRITLCSFRYFWGGGVHLAGNNGVVSNCIFREVQNKATPTEGDYGSIHINGSQNLVTGNQITEFSYSGVSIYGGDRNVVSNNVIVAAANFPTGGMGIYALAGVTHSLVSGNYIKGVANEGIVFIDSTLVNEHNLITGNVIEDCRYTGISLQGGTGGGWTQRYNTVSNNTIKSFGLNGTNPDGSFVTAWKASTAYALNYRALANGKVYEATVAGTTGTTAPSHTSGTAVDGTVTWQYIGVVVDTDYGIFVSDGRYNIIRGNFVQSDGQQMARGVGTAQTPIGNDIVGNTIFGTSIYGITANGENTRVQGNRVHDCPTGILFSSGERGVIENNTVRNAVTDSIVANTGVAMTIVRNNYTDKLVNTAAENFDNRVERNFYSGEATLSAGTVTVGTAAMAATLSRGVVSLSHKTPGGTPGALYVSAVNLAASPPTFTITSTSSTDTSVVLWRIVR